jgi:hypothetical protein
MTSESCTKSLPFVCMQKPLSEPADNPCPKEFSLYKEDCYLGSADKVNFTIGVEKCAAKAAILWAPREQANFEFFQQYGNKKSQYGKVNRKRERHSVLKTGYPEISKNSSLFFSISGVFGP